jgi:tRNA pseudouridine13 synthase
MTPDERLERRGERPGPLRTPVPAGPRDLFVGMDFYLSHPPGLGGVLKLHPESFRVDEISREPLPDPHGRFTAVRISAYDIEQNELVRRIASWVGVPPASVRYAGTKDRRAVTTQMLTFPGPPERLQGIPLSGVEVREAYRTNEPLTLGHLYGNRFRIRLERIPGEASRVQARFLEILEDLRSWGGFPNYFGPQRFGEIRPVTHLVGRALVQGDSGRAVDIYLAAESPAEDDPAAEARRAYREHRDPARALREYPSNLRYERILLERQGRGAAPASALRALPKPLRLLFVHAYQSYLFNRQLSLRLKEGLPLDTAEPGDWVVPLSPDGLEDGRRGIPVREENLPEIRQLLADHRARLALPLVGTGTPVLPGRTGDILRELLDAEGIRPESFHLRELPDLSSEGRYRSVLARVPLGLEHHRAISENGSSVLDLDFCLERGQYATVLLREFRKE